MMDVGSILREQRRNRNETLQVVAARAHTDLQGRRTVGSIVLVP